MFYIPRPHGDARLDIDIPIMPQLWMLGAFSLHPETGLAFNENPVRVSHEWSLDWEKTKDW